jgi:hypothetical protein
LSLASCLFFVIGRRREGGSAPERQRQQCLCYITLTDWFSITEVESVYCAVCTESLYKTDMFQFKGLTTTL